MVHAHAASTARRLAMELHAGLFSRSHAPAEELYGLPKLVWVVVANVVAMLLFISAIPLVLSCVSA